MFGAQSMNDHDQLNIFENSVFLRVHVSLLSYTVRGAAFFVTYFVTSQAFVSATSKLIATTDFPVPGHHSIINTFLLFGEEALEKVIAFSYITFCSSIMTNS